MSKQEYGAEQIQVLEGLEAVRKRPGMYIGSTGPRGLHHLVYEVVDNSIDEALAGNCSEIYISLNDDGSVTVKDNGRGIPVEVHPKTGLSTLERSEEHTSELQSRQYLVCRLLLEKKKK